MSETLQSYQSDKQGIVGELDTLAERMEWAGMSKEVSVSWAKTVRQAIEFIEQSQVNKE
jgi:Ni,Fe-hydrogenase maturation factor